MDLECIEKDVYDFADFCMPCCILSLQIHPRASRAFVYLEKLPHCCNYLALFMTFSGTVFLQELRSFIREMFIHLRNI